MCVCVCVCCADDKWTPCSVYLEPFVGLALSNLAQEVSAGLADAACCRQYGLSGLQTHTHTERKSSGCESAFGQNYIILYLDVDVVSSVICTVFYCEQHQCYLSELFKNTQKNDRILLHKYPKSLCLTRLWASSDLTRVYKARGLSRGEIAHCIMQISSQQLYRTLTSE